MLMLFYVHYSGQTVIEPQGCFADRSANPDLPYMKDFGSEPMLPVNCTTHCAMMNYTVAGVQVSRLKHSVIEVEVDIIIWVGCL